MACGMKGKIQKLKYQTSLQTLSSIMWCQKWDFEHENRKCLLLALKVLKLSWLSRIMEPTGSVPGYCHKFIAHSSDFVCRGGGVCELSEVGLLLGNYMYAMIAPIKHVSEDLEQQKSSGTWSVHLFSVNNNISDMQVHWMQWYIHIVVNPLYRFWELPGHCHPDVTLHSIDILDCSREWWQCMQLE